MDDVNTVCTGVCYTCSMIKAADITDGTSDTYLAGEKYLDPDAYMTGSDNCDNEAALVGHDDDIGAGRQRAVARRRPLTRQHGFPRTPIRRASVRCAFSAALICRA